MNVLPCLLVLDINFNSVLAFDLHSGSYIDDFVASGSGGLWGGGNMVVGANGDLFVASEGFEGETTPNGSVLRYEKTSGAFLGSFVTPGSGGLLYANGIAFGPDGNLYVVNSDASVLRYDGNTGAFIDVFVAVGSGGLTDADSLAFGLDGRLYIAAEKSILRYDGTTGAFIGVFVAPGAGGLDHVGKFTFGLDENLYVISSDWNSVLRFDGASGVFLGEFVASYNPAPGSQSPALIGNGGLKFGPDGNLYVSGVDGTGRGCVVRYDGASGGFLGIFALFGVSDTGPSDIRLSQPVDLVFSQIIEPVWRPIIEKWHYVPSWLWGIVGFIFGVLVGQAIAGRESPGGRRSE